MSAIELGKRYERLMMSSAPLAIAAAFLLFTSMASRDQNQSKLARCYEAAAQMVHENKDQLSKDWEFHKRYSSSPAYVNLYEMGIRIQWIEPSVKYRCDAIDAEVRSSGTTAPDELRSKWLAESKRLANAPIEMKGITVESETQITILGTKVRVRLSTLATALQFALGPLLVLWLGSLYQTRFRESIYNSRAASIVEVYPHLINVYPAYTDLALRKRVKLFLFIRPHWISAGLFTCLRMAFVGVVLSPTVLLYIWSLTLIPLESQTGAHVVLGMMVGFFAFGVLLAEALPWHWSKVFHTVQRD